MALAHRRLDASLDGFWRDAQCHDMWGGYQGYHHVDRSRGISHEKPTQPLVLDTRLVRYNESVSPDHLFRERVLPCVRAEGSTEKES